jgi:hypothetical protein
VRVTAEYKGYLYTFDPARQAKKDLGITEVTAENRTALAKKTLEYMKHARRRAHVGAVLRFARDQIGRGRDICVEAIFSALQDC